MKRLTQLTLILTFIVIILGAYTRLKDAGLGCPDWPGCYGTLTVPASEEQALEKYPTAEFDLNKAWIEVAHRMFAGTLGLLIFALLIINILRTTRGEEKLSLILIFTAVVVIAQTILGMLTVTLQLLPLVVTAHLTGGLLTFSLVFTYLLHLYRRETSSQLATTSAPAAIMTLAIKCAYLGLVLIIVQILLGGWVSTNYAALACTDFPLCNGQLVPEADFATGFDLIHPLGVNYEGGVLNDAARVAIHWTHRIGALVVVLFWLGFYAWSRSRKVDIKDEISTVLIIMAVQVMLGITNVLGDLPLVVATAHNGTAAILLLSAIVVVFKCSYYRRSAHRYE